MNEVEYILRIVLKARDELATALKRAREELRLFAAAADSNAGKIDRFNESIAKMDKNVSNITDKFREWRAVIQGAGEGSDDAKKSITQLNREIETSVKTTTRNVKAMKDYRAEASAANKEVKELAAAQKRGGVDADFAIARINKLGKELEALSLKFKSSTRDAERAFDWSRNAKKAAAEIIRINDDITADAKAEADKRVRIAEEEAQKTERVRKDAVKSFVDDVNKEIQATREGHRVTQQLDREAERERKRTAMDRASAAASEASERVRIAKAESDAITAESRAADAQRRLNARHPAGKPIDPSLVVDAKRASAEFKRLSGEFKHDEDASRRFATEAEKLSRSLRKVERDASKSKPIWIELRDAFEGNKESAAGLDNSIRGMAWLLLAGFAQQAITILTGLGGAFVAVASSAAEAGLAIGGTFVAGIAQAMPAIGLMAGALFRLKSVMDVVKQAQLTQKQEAVQQAGAGRRVADATDAITNANEALVKAQERLQESQDGLTKARRDARRDLEDLIRAEKNAALAAAGAALSQKEAQQALIEAQASGDVGGIQRAQLAVLQAQADAEESISDKRRARQDAEKARRGGPEGMEGVDQAKKAVADAADAVAKAQRGIETAKRNAGEAAAGTITAAAQLNYLLAQLSPAERKLYTALTNIQNAYKKTYRPITDLIINSFTRSVEGVQKIMLMPEVIKLATQTSKQISKSLNSIFDAFTTNDVIKQMLRIGEEGRKNLKPLTDIVINLGKIFLNIAEAGGPALRRLLRFVGDLVDKFLTLTENRSKLTDFFTEGEKHFEAWAKLGIAVIKLFAALAGAGGAQTGVNLVKDATKALDDLTKKVNDNKGKVAAFFEDSRGVVHEVVSVIKALAIELFHAFTPERVHSFSKLLKDIVIPALGDAVEFMGNITNALLNIADSPAGEFFLKLGIMALFLWKVMGPVLHAFYDLGKFLFTIGKPIVGWLRSMESIEALVVRLAPLFKSIFNLRMLAFGAGFVGIALAIVFLLDKLGLLDDAWDAVKGGFNAFWKEVQPALKRLMASFADLWDAVKQGRGLFGILGAVIKPVLKVIIDLGGVFLRVFGRTIGRILSGLLDILSGVIEFITGVFTGDWRKAWNGIKRVFGGILRAITAPLRALPELILEIGKKLLPALKKGAEALWGWLEKLPGRLKDLAIDAAKAFVEGFKDVGGDIIDGILGGLSGAAKLIDKLVNAFIDLINKAIPDKIDIPGPLGSISLPKNPIPHLASGGPIGSGYGGGDRRLILAEEGEHMLSKEEVRSAGGHGAIYALRALLGGGKQGGPFRFRDGGAVETPPTGGLTITFEGSNLDDFVAAWRSFWSLLVLVARRGVLDVRDLFHSMRVSTTNNMDGMYREIRSRFGDIQTLFKNRGERIITNWDKMWFSLKDSTFKGLFYIGHETNKALVALGEKHIDFSLKQPEKADGKAGGGWIGSQGNRGRDRGLYPLGAGEAVLNWQHQKYVEPAMNAYYGHGLSTMFDRVHGYHAGGPGQTGFAGGGIVPIPGQPGESISSSILNDVLKLIKQYKLKVYDGLGSSPPHAPNSDHLWGGAIDVGPALDGSWDLVDRLAHWAEPAQNAPRKPFRWVGYDGDPGHGRGNHLHLSWIKGAHLGNLGDFMTKVLRPIITGPTSALKTIGQKALDTVLKGANSVLSAAFGATTEPGETSSTDLKAAGPVSDYNHLFDAGLSIGEAAVTKIAQWAGLPTPLFTQIARGESSYQPGAIGHDPGGTLGYGLWQITTSFSDADVAFANKGKVDYNEMRNPLKNALATKHKYDSASVKTPGVRGFPWYGTRYVTGKAKGGFVDEYASGGIIPGPEGAPVPILAHAREWILNPGQVNRLANLVGVSRDALRSMMGFHGGKGSFQGGGEAEDVTPLTPKQAKGISIRSVRRLVLALQKIGDNFDKAAVEMGSVERWSGFLDRSAGVFNRLTRRLSRRRVKGDNLENGVKGFLDAMDTLLNEETGVFTKLRASIELRATRIARRLTRQQFRIGPGGVVLRRQRQTEEVIAQDALDEQVRQRGDLTGERDDIRRSLRQVRRQQRRKGLTPGAKNRLQAQEQRLIAMADEAQQRVVDNIVAINEAQIAAQQASVDAINKQYERELNTNEIARRVATALGQESIIASLNDAQVGILTRQRDALQAQIAQARAAGATELVDSLTDQVADLTTSITETIQQNIRDTVDRINTAAQRRLGALDVAGRMLDALGVVGLTGVAAAGGLSRAGIFQQRGQALGVQQAGLQGQLRAASAAGNLGLVDELTDALADLSATIQENTRSLFTAKVEDVNNRAGFALQINDLNKQLSDLEDTAAGQVDQQRVANSLMQRGNILAQQRAELEALLAEATKNQDQQAINDLTIALLENQIAIKQNTNAVDEANGLTKDPQTFTSSAWTRFREAIFSGMGQVLPQYDPTNMGMTVTGAGIYPSVTGSTSSRVSGDTNINLYEAGRPVDLQEVSSAVVWANKTSQ